jgi:ABC-2 type transport system permease protein
MNLARTFATTGRVLTQIRHDPRTIALLLVVPSLLIGLVAWMFTDTDVFTTTIGPAMLALFPFIVMFLVTSIATLRERRSGTLERLFSMPLGKGDFILGYAIAFGFLAIFQTAIAVAFAVWVCGLEIEGSIWLLFAVAISDALLGTALGLLASAFARTEFQVVQFLPLFVFPQVLLGGIFLPTDQLPAGLEAISEWLPLTYAIDALNAVATGSETDEWIATKLMVVGAWIIGSIILGSITLRRRTP